MAKVSKIEDGRERWQMRKGRGENGRDGKDGLSLVGMHGLGCAFGYGNISFDSVGDPSNSHLNSHFIGICKSLSIRDAPYSPLESGFPLDPRFLSSISFELMSSYYQLLSAAFRRRGAFLFSEEGLLKETKR